MLGLDIANKLQALGVGTVGTDIFIGTLPGSPDAAICVIETGGFEPEIDTPLSNPTFQVLVRSTTYELAKTKLAAVKAALHQRANFSQGSTYFYYILANTEGGHIGRDANAREEFSINFRCKTRAAS